MSKLDAGMVLVTTEKFIRLPEVKLHVTDELLTKLYQFETQLVWRPVSTEAHGGWTFKASDDGKIQVFDLTTGEKRREFASGHLRSIRRMCMWQDALNAATKPKPQLITASGDGTLKVFDFEGKMLRHLKDGHTGKVMCVCVNQDEPYEDTTVVSGGQDMSVRFWSLKQGKQRALCKGHEFIVTGVCFCEGRADIKLVASIDQATVINLWALDSGTLMRTLGFNPVLRDPERKFGKAKPSAAEAAEAEAAAAAAAGGGGKKKKGGGMLGALFS